MKPAGPKFSDRFLRVERIIDETPETKSFILDLAGEPLCFLPGQFVNVTLTLPGGRRVRRAYSIASSPFDMELMLTVKRMEDGLVSKYLCDEVKRGDVLHVRGPYGVFILDQSALDVAFIAGGSGIVPFRSMWRYLRQTGSTAGIVLLYASKSLAYVIYRRELDELSWAGDRVVHTFTRDIDPLWTGYRRRIDREMLAETFGNLSEKLFYVCGPPSLCNSVVACLSELGVDGRLVKTEKYD